MVKKLEIMLDSTSFAVNFWWAAQGSFVNPDLNSTGSEIASRSIQPSQRRYYEILMEKLHSPSSRVELDIILMRSIINMLAPFEIDFENKVKLSVCFEVLTDISISDRAKAIKT